MGTTTTTHPAPNPEYESKDSLVISSVMGGPSNDGEVGARGGRAHISPREGLTVAFRSAVETIQSQLLQAIVLGVVIAIFTMVGVDNRRWKPANARYTRPTTD